MREGALRKRDPEGVARILIGSLWYFAFMEASLEQRNTGLSSNAFCKELARMLHDDLRPRR